METASPFCTAFDGDRLLAAGTLVDVALAVKAALKKGADGPVLTFDDATGAVIDLDLRGSKADIVARLSPPGAPEPDGPRGRGRPKLGVVAREVTLLPRHGSGWRPSRAALRWRCANWSMPRAAPMTARARPARPGRRL